MSTDEAWFDGVCLLKTRTIAAVPHLGVFDRDATVGCHSPSDANCPRLGPFEVLLGHLVDGLQVKAQWLANHVIQVPLYPIAQ